MKAIEILKELQKIDSQVFKTKEALEDKPRQIAILEEEFAERSSLLKRLEDELKKVQIGHKEKDLELQSKEASVDKHKNQLSQIKTNKEYNALQVEIEKMKADNSLLEEQIIMLLDKIDTLKASINKEKELLAQEEKKLKTAKAAVELEIRELQETINKLNLQRKIAITADLKPEVLDLYERIRENRGEIAIVPVRDGSCSGCFMNLRAQVLNELSLGKLLTCDTCSRILYVESEN
ncbi:MAG: C4-type zinc ribbon domain-containing protein [Candidatus Omnitrophota bacterium]